MKLIKSMIKEANKINLSFHELSLLSKVHRHAEEWMDRANVALRSKISLNELESLIKYFGVPKGVVDGVIQY